MPQDSIPNDGDPRQIAVAASAYSFTELADIYNQSRVDYIVPMPMNARRMQEYIYQYAVDLDASCVAQDEAGDILGIGMLGLRGERAWITRLGVIPQRRRYHTGLFMMETLLAAARERLARSVQLEVIEGNEPALRLFTRLGFVARRILLVSRRAPAPSAPLPAQVQVGDLEPGAIDAVIARHMAHASWIEEADSLYAAGSLQGLCVQLPEGAFGSAVYRCTSLQITHLLLDIAPEFGDAAAVLAPLLLNAVHGRLPSRDSKLENLPLTSPYWDAYQSVGYRESFRRIEMLLAPLPA